MDHTDKLNLTKMIDANNDSDTYFAFRYLKQQNPKFTQIEFTNFIKEYAKNTEPLLLKEINSYSDKYQYKLCNGLTIGTMHKFIFEVPMVKATNAISTTSLQNLNSVEKIKNAYEKYLKTEDGVKINFLKKSIEWENAVCEARIEIMKHDSSTSDNMNLFFQGWSFADGRDDKINYPLIGIFDYNDAHIEVLNNSVGKNGELKISKNENTFLSQSYSDKGELGDNLSALVKFNDANTMCDFFAVCVILDEDIPRILLVYVVILPFSFNIPISVKNTFEDLILNKILTIEQQTKAQTIFLEFFNNKLDLSSSSSSSLPKSSSSSSSSSSLSSSSSSSASISNATKPTTNPSTNFTLVTNPTKYEYKENPIQNGGSKCYFNAIIQCLMHCEPFVDFLLKYKAPNESIKPTFLNILKSTYDTISGTTIATGNDHPFTKMQNLTSGTHTEIEILLSNTATSGQHQDANEFFGPLIDSVETELCSNNSLEPQCLEFEQLFYNITRKKLTCKNCDYINIRLIEKDPTFAVEIFGFNKDEQVEYWDNKIKYDATILSCNSAKNTCNISYISGSKTIKQNDVPFRKLRRLVSNKSNAKLDKNYPILMQKLFDRYFDEEIMEEQNYSDCRRCKTKNVYKQQIILEKCPQILICYPKRFVSSAHAGEKTHNPLDVSKPENNTLVLNGVNYELFATANHSGNTKGGHYIAWIKNDSNNWREFDDGKAVQDASITTNLDGPYVLFYKRTSTTDEPKTLITTIDLLEYALNNSKSTKEYIDSIKLQITDLTSKDNWGRSLLFPAALSIVRDNSQIIQEIISAGANPLEKDKSEMQITSISSTIMNLDKYSTYNSFANLKALFSDEILKQNDKLQNILTNMITQASNMKTVVPYFAKLIEEYKKINTDSKEFDWISDSASLSLPNQSALSSTFPPQPPLSTTTTATTTALPTATTTTATASTTTAASTATTAATLPITTAKTLPTATATATATTIQCPIIIKFSNGQKDVEIVDMDVDSTKCNNNTLERLPFDATKIVDGTEYLTFVTFELDNLFVTGVDFTIQSRATCDHNLQEILNNSIGVGGGGGVSAVPVIVGVTSVSGASTPTASTASVNGSFIVATTTTPTPATTNFNPKNGDWISFYKNYYKVESFAKTDNKYTINYKYNSYNNKKYENDSMKIIELTCNPGKCSVITDQNEINQLEGLPIETI